MCAATLVALLPNATAAKAQGTQLSPVAQIIGQDVSVQGPSAPGTDNERGGASIMVGNGSVVIVHSGKARLALLSGGTVDICGPAKFTMLQSNGAVTLAVELGRMRVRLPATATLRLFTPTIVATPLEISGGARDITVGLDQNNSLCVLATSGAIQLEHQFTGEKLIVPQTGEFFLNAGKLLPVVGKAGSCQCAEMSQPLIPAPAEPPDYAKNTAPLAREDLQRTSVLPIEPTPPAEKPAPDASASSSSVEFSIPAHANEAHPVAPADKSSSATISPPTPATLMPTYTVVAPPLSFSAKSPAPPPDPPIDTFLLVREAQVQQAWEYKGHVDAPTFADAMQHALGEGATGATAPAVEPPKKRSGLWSFWRRIF
ncbi:MAG TPA: hypothetical protein VG322_01245 [Candidatus Acidoferrales bacterium]|nr:hypothetical protein [Candidatus Acidoferrales bacterium]